MTARTGTFRFGDDGGEFKFKKTRQPTRQRTPPIDNRHTSV
jgi:hypothetical protein